MGLSALHGFSCPATLLLSSLLQAPSEALLSLPTDHSPALGPQAAGGFLGLVTQGNGIKKLSPGPPSPFLYQDLQGEDTLSTWAEVMSHSSKVCRKIHLLSRQAGTRPTSTGPTSDPGQSGDSPRRLPLVHAVVPQARSCICISAPGLCCCGGCLRNSVGSCFLLGSAPEMLGQGGRAPAPSATRGTIPGGGLHSSQEVLEGMGLLVSIACLVLALVCPCLFLSFLSFLLPGAISQIKHLHTCPLSSRGSAFGRPQAKTLPFGGSPGRI